MGEGRLWCSSTLGAIHFGWDRWAMGGEKSRGRRAEGEEVLERPSGEE